MWARGLRGVYVAYNGHKMGGPQVGGMRVPPLLMTPCGTCIIMFGMPGTIFFFSLFVLAWASSLFNNKVELSWVNCCSEQFLACAYYADSTCHCRWVQKYILSRHCGVYAPSATRLHSAYIYTSLFRQAAAQVNNRNKRNKKDKKEKKSTVNERTQLN